METQRARRNQVQIAHGFGLEVMAQAAREPHHAAIALGVGRDTEGAGEVNGADVSHVSLWGCLSYELCGVDR
jgi:hypothetical protein